MTSQPSRAVKHQLTLQRWEGKGDTVLGPEPAGFPRTRTLEAGARRKMQDLGGRLLVLTEKYGFASIEGPDAFIFVHVA